MEKLNFEFTVDEINTILASLTKQPYETVAQLVAKIKIEGDKQLNPIQSIEKESSNLKKI